MSEMAWLKKYLNLDFVKLGVKDKERCKMMLLSFCFSSLPCSTFDEIKIEISFELSIFKRRHLLKNKI